MGGPLLAGVALAADLATPPRPRPSKASERSMVVLVPPPPPDVVMPSPDQRDWLSGPYAVGAGTWAGGPLVDTVNPAAATLAPTMPAAMMPISTGTLLPTALGPASFAPYAASMRAPFFPLGSYQAVAAAQPGLLHHGLAPPGYAFVPAQVRTRVKGGRDDRGRACGTPC